MSEACCRLIPCLGRSISFYGCGNVPPSRGATLYLHGRLVDCARAGLERQYSKSDEVEGLSFSDRRQDHPSTCFSILSGRGFFFEGISSLGRPMHGGCGYDHRTIAYPIWALRTPSVARVAALIPLVPSSLSMVASCGCQLWLAGMCELQSRRKNSRHVHEDYINTSEIASIVESCPGPPSYC